MSAKYNRTRHFYPHLEPIFAGIYKRFILKSGANDQNRTGDLLITKKNLQVLKPPDILSTYWNS